jgi:hypothetical protein
VDEIGPKLPDGMANGPDRLRDCQHMAQHPDWRSLSPNNGHVAIEEDLDAGSFESVHEGAGIREDDRDRMPITGQPAAHP